jgi:hypothetical protein
MGPVRINSIQSVDKKNVMPIKNSYMFDSSPYEFFNARRVRYVRKLGAQHT